MEGAGQRSDDKKKHTEKEERYSTSAETAIDCKGKKINEKVNLKKM